VTKTLIFGLSFTFKDLKKYMVTHNDGVISIFFFIYFDIYNVTRYII